MKKFKSNNQVVVTTTAVLLGGALYAGLKKIMYSPKRTLKGKRVFISGGSRGLGLALAEQYAIHGAHLIISARNVTELKHAKEQLSKLNSQVIIIPCDITREAQISRLVQKIETEIGKLDILINCAGIIEVGPLEELGFDHFQRVLDINLMGMIRMTLELIPFLSRGAHIINITSIGGVVAVPHLLPYCVSKFGAVGFSLGLDSELVHRGISVTTVLPGLMRTGSFVHAKFFGNKQREFDWFALGATLPLLSISARNAARQIVEAGQRRRRFIVLGPQAKVLRYLFQLFPNTLLGLMRITNRLLPRPVFEEQSALGTPGFKLRKHLPKGSVTRLGDKAGDELNENLTAA